MTREEAITFLEGIKDFYGDEYKDGHAFEFVALEEKEIEALEMAIEALQSDAVQGCDGCRHNTRKKQCLCCKRYWRDEYERKGGDTE